MSLNGDLLGETVEMNDRTDMVDSSDNTLTKSILPSNLWLLPMGPPQHPTTDGLTEVLTSVENSQARLWHNLQKLSWETTQTLTTNISQNVERQLCHQNNEFQDLKRAVNHSISCHLIRKR